MRDDICGLSAEAGRTAAIAWLGAAVLFTFVVSLTAYKNQKYPIFTPQAAKIVGIRKSTAKMNDDGSFLDEV